MPARTDGCVYCGWPRARIKTARAVRVLPACRAHLDLLELDPVYGLARTLARETYPALDLEALSPSHLRIEAAW